MGHVLIPLRPALRSYIGFFVILWGTWFQVAKYDVRFGNDSAFERLCKALQFGVMVGFAVTGPNFLAVWDPDTPEGQQNLRVYQTLTLILMASRLILAAQYLAVYYWLKEYSKARLPLIVHIATAIGSAMIFLGLFWSFNPSTPGNNGNGIIAWYVTLALEAVIILFVSGRVRFMSFRHTPMVERLGLLTLIILGEGVIGLTQAVDKVSRTLQFTPDIIGQIIAAVGIIYAMWMLYYDQTEKRRVGRLRQELWTVLHFPLHICILLVVQGQATLTIWRKILDIMNPFWNSDALNIPLLTDPYNNTPLDGTDLTNFVNSLNQSIADLFSNLSPPNNVVPFEISDALVQIADSKGNVTVFYDSVSGIIFNNFVEVCAAFNIKPPEVNVLAASTDPSGLTAASDITNVFYAVFTYFFIAAGFTIIILTFLLRLGRREKYRSEMFAMVVRFLIGIGLALISLMNLPSLSYSSSGGAIGVYLFSPWMLPTVLICYMLGEFLCCGYATAANTNTCLVVVIVDNVVANHIRKKYMKWRSNFLGMAV